MMKDRKKRETLRVEVQIAFRVAKCGEDEVGAGRSHLTWYLFCVNTQKDRKKHGGK
jgi:hypothetical protein